MAKKKECEHNWKGLYYREKLPGKSQMWKRLKDLSVCDKCFKIVKVKSEEVVKK